MDTHARTIDTERRGFSRRTVVKGAVATAWTVPLVQVVAAPIAAAVSGPTNLSSTSGSVTFGPADAKGNRTFTVTATIKNTGGTSTSGLTATLTWTPKNKNSGTLGTVGRPTGSATWTGSGTTWTAGTQVPPGGTQSFNLTGTLLAGRSLNGTLSVSFTAAGSSGGVSGKV